MKLYRFLDHGEMIAEGDEFWSPSGIDWTPSAKTTAFGVGATVGGGLPYRRLVAEVPDDANIAAALIAAEIVETLRARRRGRNHTTRNGTMNHRIQYQNDAMETATSDEDGAYVDEIGKLRQVADGGNLTSSKTRSGTHLPVIDLDFPCRLVPSRTDGHWHLYIDRETNFDLMIDALDAMRRAGWVQRGFVDGAKRRGAAMVRTEGTFVPHQARHD